MNIKSDAPSLDVLKRIKALVFDIDGVLSDGTVYLPNVGSYVRRINVKDAYALQLAVKCGYHVAVISGGSSEPVKERLKALGVWDVNLRVISKLDKLEEILLSQNIEAHETLYMGDDIPDWEVMKSVGLPCAPADASTEILDLAMIIATKKGGEGCVREVIEKVMRAQGKWFASKMEEQFKW